MYSTCTPLLKKFWCPHFFLVLTRPCSLLKPIHKKLKRFLDLYVPTYIRTRETTRGSSSKPWMAGERVLQQGFVWRKLVCLRCFVAVATSRQAGKLRPEPTWNRLHKHSKVVSWAASPRLYGRIMEHKRLRSARGRQYLSPTLKLKRVFPSCCRLGFYPIWNERTNEQNLFSKG